MNGLTLWVWVLSVGMICIGVYDPREFTPRYLKANANPILTRSHQFLSPYLQSLYLTCPILAYSRKTQVNRVRSLLNVRGILLGYTCGRRNVYFNRVALSIFVKAQVAQAQYKRLIN